MASDGEEVSEFRLWGAENEKPRHISQGETWMFRRNEIAPYIYNFTS